MRPTQKAASNMRIRDLREIERRPAPEFQPIRQILGHLPHRELRFRPKSNDRDFEALATPEKLREFTVSFSGVAAFPKPSHAMANRIILELVGGRGELPAYVMYIVPDQASAPWPIDTQEHQSAAPRLRTSARQAHREKSRQALPMQSWVLYQLRFFIAAGLAGDWKSFGCFIAQLGQLSIVLHISTTYTTSVALSYGRLVKDFLVARARPRAEYPVGGDFFLDFISEENHPLKLRAIAAQPARVAPKQHEKIHTKKKPHPKNDTHPDRKRSPRRQSSGVLAPARCGAIRPARRKSPKRKATNRS